MVRVKSRLLVGYYALVKLMPNSWYQFVTAIIVFRDLSWPYSPCQRSDVIHSPASLPFVQSDVS